MADGVRLVAALLGGAMVLGGLVGFGSGAWVEGLWAAVSGAVILVAVVLERSRYRSEAAERSAEPPGPGGGEPSAPGAPFRPTDEVFVDPTSGHRLRVYLNPATGERRYHAEGVRDDSS